MMCRNAHPLSVGRVLERIKDLLQRNRLLGFPVDGPPDDAIGALAQFLDDLVLALHVTVDLVSRHLGATTATARLNSVCEEERDGWCRKMGQ